jgi:hypothetical protein
VHIVFLCHIASIKVDIDGLHSRQLRIHVLGGHIVNPIVRSHEGLKGDVGLDHENFPKHDQSFLLE